jgi:L-talarate/galactarate dehydratase
LSKPLLSERLGNALLTNSQMGDPMKISAIRSQTVALPADEPLAGAAENPNGTRPIVTLEIETDDGVTGVGVTYFGGALTGTLRNAVNELGAQIVGDDPLRVEAVVEKLRAAAGSAGPGGIFHLALSALEWRCGTSGARR